MINIDKIQELLMNKASLESRLKLLPYQGTPEIKVNSGLKYIYLRKRELGKLKTTYVDKYSDALYTVVVNSAKIAKELIKQIRKIEKELALLGYSINDLSPRVLLNLDFARANMKNNIYDQAILEGIATTFPQTETIIENGIVYGMIPRDIQKILNLKHAWEFVLNKDIIVVDSDFYILSHIAKLVNEGIYENGGKVRAVPVKIGGSTNIPPIPVEVDVKKDIFNILNKDQDAVDISIELCLYCMKKQIFIDGNKRAAVIFANHYLISKGEGLLIIPADKVSEFKELLVLYYEEKDNESIKIFLKEKCWSHF